MPKNYKQGWYELLNPSKYIIPSDDVMKSFHEDGYVKYKSSYELKAIEFCDNSNKVELWSLEPFPIKYIKPTDNKYHRYYVDLFVKFTNGERVIAEIKPKNQTFLPKNPTPYQLVTYAINKAKWDAAKEYAERSNIRFTILDEDVLSRL